MRIVNNIEWFIKHIVNIFLELILSVFIKKDKTLLLFGSKPLTTGKDVFLNSSKYLFLFLQNQNNYKTVWLCDDDAMIKEFHTRGIKNVYKRKSFIGIKSILKAKYWFCDFSANQISTFNSSLSKSIIINFWHGGGKLKKVGYDASADKINKSNPIRQKTIIDKIYSLLKCKNDYYITNCDFDAQWRKTAFGATENQNIMLGYPRLDVLFNDIEHSTIFMEEDYNNIKKYKESNKKIIVYVPTFRDTNIDISGWLKSKKFHEFLEQNDIVLVCKLHPFDTNSLSFELPSCIYKMTNTSDIYPILKYTDAMITDYSSIYFDYLLLKKPIIYYVPDLLEYQEKCRGFYAPYEEVTAGAKPTNQDDLIKEIVKVINQQDEYKIKRELLLNEFYYYQDDNNCQRILSFLEELND